MSEAGRNSTVEATIPRMTVEEWRAEGRRRFGENFDEWKAVCPICGNVQSVGDFRQFKDRGATPDTTFQQCIGRFTTGPIYRGFGENKKDAPKQPCDYAIFGLFRLPGVIVVLDGKEVLLFAFADVEARLEV